MKVLISFGFSSSRAYMNAVEMATEFAGYRTDGEGKTVRHTIELDDCIFTDPELLDDVIQLLDIVKDWVSTSIVAEGRSKRRRIRVWLFILHFCEVVRCHHRRIALPYGDDYCVGKNSTGDAARNLGCRFLPGCPAWSEFGEFVDETNRIYRIRKSQIKEYLSKTVSKELFVNCPGFSWERINSQVDYLPEYIDLTSDGQWEVKYDDKEKTRAIGIRQKDGLAEFNRTLKEIIGTNCPVCGRLMAKSFSFCPDCGSSIDQN